MNAQLAKVFAASLLLLCALALTVGAEDQTVSNGELRVKVLGQSGKIAYWVPALSDEQTTITFDFLRETQNGDSFQGFSSQQFNFSQLQDTSFQGISAKKVKFESLLSSGDQSNVRLEADILVFQESGNYTVNQESFTAVKNSFKWSFTITGWQFDKAGSSLELGLKLHHPSSKAQWNEAAYTLSFPEVADIQFARQGTCDDQWQPVGVSASVHGSNVDLVFTFAQGNKIWYDPQTTVATSGSASLRPLSLLGAFLSLFF